MFGPLSFTTKRCSRSPIESKCLLCDEQFQPEEELAPFLKHLFENHSLVIDDVQNIDNLRNYLSYWNERFSKVFFETIVPSLSIDSVGGKYYLLSPLMKEDRELRHKLKLENALQVQEFERTDTNYMRDCLFCKLKFEGCRLDYLKHLSEKHNLQLGNPQNLVFVEDFIERINDKLNNLQCVYCEKVFTDRTVLKEHMRKKLHKRVNPQNQAYDKYYIVNYLEADKNWQSLQNEDDNLPIVCGDTNGDEEYSDWNENADQISCLFCARQECDIEDLCAHMRDLHGFDFVESTGALDFYQKIKFVNYARRQVHKRRCLFCDGEFGDDLSRHLVQEGHFRVPEMCVFDQPEYYFPTYENDAFLYLIDDVCE